MPGVACVLRFLSTHVVVMSGSNQSVSEVCSIAYDEIDALEATGSGRRSYMQGYRFMGGGVGIAGAIEGMAVASILNSVFSSAVTTMDTVVDLRAGEREVLFRNYMFEPATLRVILAPATHRIKGARDSRRAPAGWYADTNLPGMQRYWDGTRWTDHTAPLH
jgi:hypothetical protein